MEQARLPLYEQLLIHQKKQPISFHVPGHKNGLLYKSFDPAFQQAAHFDVTELAELDDLHDPHEAIAEAQQLLSQLFKTKKSYFLVNGSTSGNLAMILAACNEGDTVLVQRNCHKSILHGLQLANVNPVFISQGIDKELHIPLGPNLQLIERACYQYPNVKVCILTYPDYYGQTYDLQEIIEFLHQQNIVVVVDEAHGAHFQLGQPFPASALTLGADIVVQSAHKTLPALTMGSYLHVNSNRISEDKVQYYLTVLQSSSPSYLIMASLDYARHYLAHFSGSDLAYTIQQRNLFIEQLQAIRELKVIESSDPIKLLIRHDQWIGYQLQKNFDEVGVFTELADPYQLLMIFPLLKETMEFPIAEVISRIKGISRKDTDGSKPIPLVKISPKISNLALSFRKMDKMKYEWVKIDKSMGKVAAKMIVPYPPGIPLLLRGEIITNEHIAQLKSLLKTGARFQGNVEQLLAGNIAVFPS